MVAVICGMLIYVNATVFNLISPPGFVNDLIAFVALGLAIGLTIITLTIIIRDKRRSLLLKTQKLNVLDANKETDKAPELVPSPTIVQKSTIIFKDDQKTLLAKQPIIQLTKVICPACRKEFSLPDYEKDYIVDFGPPKKTNLIKKCPNCKTAVPLKYNIGILEEEDIWKE